MGADAVRDKEAIKYNSIADLFERLGPTPASRSVRAANLFRALRDGGANGREALRDVARQTSINQPKSTDQI